MPGALNLQTVIAFVWDFDKTLSPGYMQGPLFEEYQIDEAQFWAEVNGLVDHYESRGLRVSRGTPRTSGTCSRMFATAACLA